MTLTAQTDGVPDHATPQPTDDPTRAAAAARYAATLLPAVLWLLGVHVFHGDVPAELQGVVGLAVTALCTAAVRVQRSRGS